MIIDIVSCLFDAYTLNVHKTNARKNIMSLFYLEFTIVKVV